MDDFDSILLVSFGGPEGPDDVLPFLENVLRGKNVPEARKREVAKNYEIFGGQSPLNPFMRSLRENLASSLAASKTPLPVYWGNRNWTPYLEETLARMRDEGRRRAVVVMTSAFSSYSGCRQYREDIERALAKIGWQEFTYAKARTFFNHPEFIRANAEGVSSALAESGVSHGSVRLIFTAHSLPLAMAKGCAYERQLIDACEGVSQQAGFSSWQLAYQSRSGPPTQPWLEPSVLDAIHAAKAEGRSTVLVVPIGFVTDHVEVLFDLDHQARALAEEIGVGYLRAKTAGHHPAFLPMILDLIEEVRTGALAKTVGNLGIDPNACSPGCCPRGER